MTCATFLDLHASMFPSAKIGMARKERPYISKLKDTLIKEKFNIALKNRFSILQDKTALIIDDFITAVMGSSKETIGYTKTCISEWISPDTWRTMEDRRQLKKKALDSKSPSLKEKALAQYREKDKKSRDISKKRQKRVCGETCDGGSRITWSQSI